MGGAPVQHVVPDEGLADVANNQKMNGDGLETFLDGVSLLAAQITRMPGFYQTGVDVRCVQRPELTSPCALCRSG